MAAGAIPLCKLRNTCTILQLLANLVLLLFCQRGRTTHCFPFCLCPCDTCLRPLD
ncbi:hypothetical protein X962_5637 [Burkholderia pseudomallei MSHR7343]|nr:hypothetical protein X962_5637 [Burkholderia pseudomallei MSHR7343]